MRRDRSQATSSWLPFRRAGASRIVTRASTGFPLSISCWMIPPNDPAEIGSQPASKKCASTHTIQLCLITGQLSSVLYPISSRNRAAGGWPRHGSQAKPRRRGTSLSTSALVSRLAALASILLRRRINLRPNDDTGEPGGRQFQPPVGFRRASAAHLSDSQGGSAASAG